MGLATHIGGLLLLVVSFLVGVGIWVAVQSTREEPLPTLVWSGDLAQSAVIAASPMVLDHLGKGWWWIYAAPADRVKLRELGVRLAVAVPTPLAQMAGCSLPY
ncbi:MAG: hypothetical protein ACK5E2_02485 [Burkholderiales bacterium]